MSLFSRAFNRLFGCLTPIFGQRVTQRCAAQELTAVEKLPESDSFNITANHDKCSRKHGERPKKHEKGKPLQTPAWPSILKPTKGKRAKLQDNSGDFTLPDAHFQPLPPVKRPPVCLVKEAQEEFTLPGCPLQGYPPKLLAAPLSHPVPAADKLFSSRFSAMCPPSPIPAEGPGEAFTLPGCPLQVPLPKVPAVPPPRPVPAADDLFSSRFSSMYPLTPITAEGSEEEFTLPGCPLQVPPPKVLAVRPPLPVSAPDEFSSQFSSMYPLRPITAGGPEEEFNLPGCSPPKVLAVSPPHPVLAPDELFPSRLSLKHPLSPIPASHEGTALRVDDIEDEESEFAEAMQALIKFEIPRLARQMLAREEEEEEEDEVLEDESWTSELIELQDLCESGDPEAVQNDASLVCMTPLDSVESQLKVQKEPKNKGKALLVMFNWADKLTGRRDNSGKGREERKRAAHHC